ncbi:hypothetical protein UFOVP49_73 [uncultured Caudovirales phage]|uniref:Uncharacterized protein n=1 Tax=uncultured Caudovirales phage TaxID=2100421 RepID=A0A6J5KT77_9CAUD|nr:hypothetical protein UFOVP49_73 [uncultured Caudovirales phage]
MKESFKFGAKFTALFTGYLLIGLSLVGITVVAIKNVGYWGVPLVLLPLLFTVGTLIHHNLEN